MLRNVKIDIFRDLKGSGESFAARGKTLEKCWTPVEEIPRTGGPCNVSRFSISSADGDPRIHVKSTKKHSKMNRKCYLT